MAIIPFQECLSTYMMILLIMINCDRFAYPVDTLKMVVVKLADVKFT
ncbi:MAG: hypothetical protein R2568_08695 [Candidatus Scalindua sp.]|jgi:hypothetical protein|nr:hypothetical protein [Candidatus Scalindua sp.]